MPFQLSPRQISPFGISVAHTIFKQTRAVFSGKAGAADCSRGVANLRHLRTAFGGRQRQRRSDRRAGMARKNGRDRKFGPAPIEVGPDYCPVAALDGRLLFTLRGAPDQYRKGSRVMVGLSLLPRPSNPQ